MVVEQVVIDRDNNVDITLAVPIDDHQPTTIVTRLSSSQAPASGR